MTDEELQLARERLSETTARCRELNKRPAQLGEELRQCELRGDVDGADAAEAQLADLFGPAVAARTRADVLEKIVGEGELALRQAEAEAAAERAEYERRYWRSLDRDCAPPSAEAQANADRRCPTGRQIIPPAGVPDPQHLLRR